MKLAFSQQLKKTDELSEKLYSISEDMLMEVAGSTAAQVLRTSYLPELRLKSQVVVVCGPGNNGADGLVMARHLHALRLRNVKVVLCAPVHKRAPAFSKNLEIVKKMGLPIVDVKDQADLNLHSAGIIVDALFGIGFHGAVEGEYKKIIDAINAAGIKAQVVSLDTPSGLDVNTGKAGSSTIRAHLTITFGLSKPGFYIYEGPKHCGKIKVVSVGYPQALLRKTTGSVFLFTPRLARRYLPPRDPKGNKSTFGRVLVVGGHPGMWGALRLTATAAFRMGAGYVSIMPLNKGDGLKDWTQELGAESIILDRTQIGEIEKYDCVVIGPGLGRTSESRALIEEILNCKPKNCVLDADALDWLSEKPRKLPSQYVITPHSGEMARLMNTDVEAIDEDRLGWAQKGSEKFGCHVLLKGYRTVVCRPEGEIAIVHAGNQSLAKAGTGDVLSGFVGALLAQKVDNPWAALTAAYIHGRMSDHWILEHASQTLMAGDLLGRLDPVFEELMGY